MTLLHIQQFSISRTQSFSYAYVYIYDTQTVSSRPNSQTLFKSMQRFSVGSGKPNWQNLVSFSWLWPQIPSCSLFRERNLLCILWKMKASIAAGWSYLFHQALDYQESQSEEDSDNSEESCDSPAKRRRVEKNIEGGKESSEEYMRFQDGTKLVICMVGKPARKVGFYHRNIHRVTDGLVDTNSWEDTTLSVMAGLQSQAYQSQCIPIQACRSSDRGVFQPRA